jgi:hypothetical protein
MDKPREVWLPSVDTALALRAYPTQKDALKYAMDRASMSCGAKLFREVVADGEVCEAGLCYSGEITRLREKLRIATEGLEKVRDNGCQHSELCECLPECERVVAAALARIKGTHD